MDDLPQFKRTLLARYVEKFGEAPDSGAFANALAERVKERVTDFMVENLCHLSTLELCELTRSFYKDANTIQRLETELARVEEQMEANNQSVREMEFFPAPPVKKTRVRRK